MTSCVKHRYVEKWKLLYGSSVNGRSSQSSLRPCSVALGPFCLASISGVKTTFPPFRNGHFVWDNRMGPAQPNRALGWKEGGCDEAHAVATAVQSRFMLRKPFSLEPHRFCGSDVKSPEIHHRLPAGRPALKKGRKKN